MSILRHLLLLSALSPLLMGGETRTWTSADGTKQFEAEFISRQNEAVTIVREDGQELTFDLAKLHEDDRRWLNLKYPVGKDGMGEEMPPENAVFDTLVFGENRDAVSAKLEASKFVSSKVQGIFQGRTGLNGIYHTNHKIGGLLCYLFFDWNENGGLQEVTLQTENQLEDSYSGVLQACWDECISLISNIHGKALQEGKIPQASELEDGQMLASHLWRINHGGSVLLGTAKVGNGYQVVIRFTREKIEVNRTH